MRSVAEIDRDIDAVRAEFYRRVPGLAAPGLSLADEVEGWHAARQKLAGLAAREAALFDERYDAWVAAVRADLRAKRPLAEARKRRHYDPRRSLTVAREARRGVEQ